MQSHFKQIVKSFLPDRQLKKIRQIQTLAHLAYEDIRVNLLGQVLPMKPSSLSFMVNDVCNSRCQMCLIWQQKKDREISPEEFEKLLEDPFFKNIEHVGVTGGEPTLRKDLSKFFQVISNRKPKIKAASMITNGIIQEVVKQQVLACAEICRTYGINFGVMVSLDGLGEIHDAVRGVKNNFQSAIHLIQYFHSQGINTSFGCTITYSNALYVDELLDYAITEGIYGRFRVAEYIDRLYNSSQTEFIRNFDPITAYHLGLFFFRTEHGFESNLSHRKTYRNIRGMLAEAKPRQIGCPYHTQAVILTARGELLYCSPKSPVLGNALESPPGKIYFANLALRRQIIARDCDNCIHDYHVPVTFREKVSGWLETKRRQRTYDCATLVKLAANIDKMPAVTSPNQLQSKQVLIVGWYGTETAGDKAILWAIIREMRSRAVPPEKIYLSSLYPFISEWTVKEMDLGTVQVVQTYSPQFEQLCEQVDEVVVGGGPLMDIEALNHMLYAFIRVAARQAIARIVGCGIGPLESPLYIQVVKAMFKLADDISLRDQGSADRSEQDFSIPVSAVIPDPATDYVEQFKSQAGSLKSEAPVLGKVAYLSCFLREWGRDYAGILSEADYIRLKSEFEAELAALVTFIAQVRQLEVHLLPMHSFYVGGDDRIFNRRFAKTVAVHLQEPTPETRIKFARRPISPDEILQTMSQAQFNLCMRFHSVLFAETLGVPYLAIDYTGGGKIKAFLTAKGKLNRMLSLTDIASGNWRSPVERCLANPS